LLEYATISLGTTIIAPGDFLCSQVMLSVSFVMAKKLYDYHFDIGNSNTGPVGFSAVVTSTTKRKALNALKRCLPESVRVDPFESKSKGGSIEYIEVYFNDLNISVRDIDEVADHPRGDGAF